MMALPMQTFVPRAPAPSRRERRDGCVRAATCDAPCEGVQVRIDAVRHELKVADIRIDAIQRDVKYRLSGLDAQDVRINRLETSLTQRLDRLEARMTQRLDRLDLRMDAVEARMTQRMDARLDVLRLKVVDVDVRVDELEERLNKRGLDLESLTRILCTAVWAVTLVHRP